VNAVLPAAALIGLAAAVWTGGSAAARLQRPVRRRLPRLVGRRWLRPLLATGCAAALLAVGAMAVIPLMVVVGSGLVLVRRRQAAQRERAQQRQDREDVQALRALAAELRSGLPPPDALRSAATTNVAATGLRKRMLAAAAADSLGGDPALALGSDSRPGSVAAAIAAAWAVCQVTGASLAAPISRIADAAAAQLRLTREADAALASARSSARLLAILPVAGVGLGVLSGTGSLRVLFATGPGQLCLLVGTGLEFAGLAWLDRLAGGS
jgi:tight adherence protein B